MTARGSHAPRTADGGVANKLRDVNERLVLAWLDAQEQAEVQSARQRETESALNVRDEFITIAAHELRTPLTGIKASAQLALLTLHDEKPDTERVVHYLLGIVGGANRLVLLMNDLMDVSRMSNGELSLRLFPFDFGALVRVVSQRYGDIASERHYFTNELPDGPVMVAGDAVRLEQILDNLFSNAVKYSPEGGDVRATVQVHADGVVLRLTDQGIGLPSGAHQRIFEPFGRASNARLQGLPGMGMGLHICLRIAEAHGGRMWAESAGEGAGTTIGMWLPAHSG